MATMKEIAELSGVSRGTVDRVLNHRGIVNAETESFRNCKAFRLSAKQGWYCACSAKEKIKNRCPAFRRRKSVF